MVKVRIVLIFRHIFEVSRGILFCVNDSRSRLVLLLSVFFLVGFVFVHHADSATAAGTLSAQCTSWPNPQIQVQYTPPSGQQWTWAYQIATNNSLDQLLCSPNPDFPNGPYDTACGGGTTWWQWASGYGNTVSAFSVPSSQIVVGQYYSFRVKEDNTNSTSTVSNSVKVHLDQCSCGSCPTPSPTSVPLAITPSYQTTLPNIPVKMSVFGGDGLYVWDAPGGIVSGSGKTIEVLFFSNGTPALKTVSVSSGGFHASATVELPAMETYQAAIFLAIGASPTPTPTSSVTPTPLPTITPSPTVLATPSVTPAPTTLPPTPSPASIPPSTPGAPTSMTPGIPQEPAPGSSGGSGSGSSWVPPTVRVAFERLSAAQDGTIAPIAIVSAVTAVTSAVVVAVPLLGSAGAAAFGYQWFMGLLGLLPKRKKVWGTVYDASTKRPIPFAKVQLLDRNRRVLETRIADKDGRYGFLTTPESLMAQQIQIAIAPSHQGYLFPSRIPASIDTFVYNNLYYGDLIEVNDRTLINFDIPLDPVRPSSAPLVLKSPSIALGASVAALADAGFWLGMVMVPLNFVLTPNPFTFGTMCLFLGTASLRIFGISEHPFGTVTDMTTGRAMPFALITLNDMTGQRKAFTVSDERGRYFLVAERGTYQIAVVTPATIVPPRRAEMTIDAKKGWITQSLRI